MGTTGSGGMAGDGWGTAGDGWGRLGTAGDQGEQASGPVTDIAREAQGN